MTFTADKSLTDARISMEVLNALGVDSTDDVDTMIEKAIEAGRSEFRGERLRGDV